VLHKQLYLPPLSFQ